MGNSKSLLSKEQLQEYSELTYLTKTEILQILDQFSKLGKDKMELDIQHRFHVSEVMEMFPQLKYNPFRDRLFRVFSSQEDECYSFEDFLDLCSAMHRDCPVETKAGWAFQVFDFDEDGEITRADLFKMIDRLATNHFLDSSAKDKLCDVILQEIDFQNTGTMTDTDFLHAMTKMPDFAHMFRFTA